MFSVTWYLWFMIKIYNTVVRLRTVNCFECNNHGHPFEKLYYC